MNADFSRTLALLRQEKEISQRKAAADLGISQALLSHYENGVREPGLAFVKKACDYYHDSADYLLGRTLDRDGGMIDSDELYDSSDEKGTLRGSIAATLQKKLLVNTVNLLFELLGKTNCREAVTAAGQYLGAAIYPLYRALHRRGREGRLLRARRGGLLCRRKRRRDAAKPRALPPCARAARRRGRRVSRDGRRDADRQLPRPRAEHDAGAARRRRAG